MSTVVTEWYASFGANNNEVLYFHAKGPHAMITDLRGNPMTRTMVTTHDSESVLSVPHSVAVAESLWEDYSYSYQKPLPLPEYHYYMRYVDATLSGNPNVEQWYIYDARRVVAWMSSGKTKGDMWHNTSGPAWVNLSTGYRRDTNTTRYYLEGSFIEYDELKRLYEVSHLCTEDELPELLKSEYMDNDKKFWYDWMDRFEQERATQHLGMQFVNHAKEVLRPW